MAEAAEAPDPTTVDGSWDEWDAPPRKPPIPELHLEGFDGPMDLLLDLAERQRIDLGRMSVLVLVEQFVAAMETLADHVALEQRADWLVVATRLVLLRSRLLFATSVEEAETAERDAAAELRRLDTMAFVRAAASWLQTRPRLGVDIFARPALETLKPQGGYVALMEACLVVLEGRAGRPDEAAAIYRPATPDLWRVSNALARIRRMLAERPEGGELVEFLPAIPADVARRPLKARAAVASTFVAGLELARTGQAEVIQKQAFGVVRVGATAVG